MILQIAKWLVLYNVEAIYKFLRFWLSKQTSDYCVSFSWSYDFDFKNEAKLFYKIYYLDCEKDLQRPSW